MAMHLLCMCSLTRIGNDCKEMSTKFVGVNLDETLSWKLHISHITRNISRTLFAIKQTKRIIPLDSLKTLYTALIHPHISYGILAWGNVNKNTLKPLEILQKRAIRTINRAHFNSHTEPLFKSSAVLKVSDQYIFQVTMFMYDYTHGNFPNSFDRTYLVIFKLDNLTCYISLRVILTIAAACPFTTFHVSGIITQHCITHIDHNLNKV